MSSVRIPYSEAALKNEVRRKRLIWDKTDRNHKKKNLVDAAWYEVAARFVEDDVDAAFCKGEFSRMRENRLQRIRRQKKNCRSGAPGGAEHFNHQADDLSWLDQAEHDLNPNRLSNLRGAEPAVQRAVASPRRPGALDAPLRMLDALDAPSRRLDALDAPSRRLGAILTAPLRRLDNLDAPSRRRDNLDAPSRRLDAVAASPRRLDAVAASPRRLDAVAASPRRRSASSPRRLAALTVSASPGRFVISPARHDPAPSPGRFVLSPARLAPAPAPSPRRPTAGPVLQDCCAAVAAETERREEDAQLRQPAGAGLGHGPTATSSPRVPETPSSLAGSRALRHRNAPNRYSPEQLHFSRRRHIRLDTSVLSSASDNSVLSVVSSGGRRRRRARDNSFLSTILESDSVHQADTLTTEAADLVTVTDQEDQPEDAVLRQEAVQAPRGTPQGRRRVHFREDEDAIGDDPAVLHAEPGAARPTRREIAAERDRNRRDLQLARERRREGIRDNIRMQMELAQHAPQAPRPAAAPSEADPELLLLRQFLQERDTDVYSSFGNTVAGFLRAMPVSRSGNCMVHVLQYLNTESQRQD